MEGVLATSTSPMNEYFAKEITNRELGCAANSMAKGKVSEHDNIPVEFFY